AGPELGLRMAGPRPRTTPFHGSRAERLPGRDLGRARSRGQAWRAPPACRSGVGPVAALALASRPLRAAAPDPPSPPTGATAARHRADRPREHERRRLGRLRRVLSARLRLRAEGGCVAGADTLG